MKMKEALLGTKGRFFTISFIEKKTDKGIPKVRTMTCRTGVKKGITGKGMSYDPIERNLLPVVDIRKSKETGKIERRMVPLDPERVVEVKINGVRYIPDDEGNLIPKG